MVYSLNENVALRSWIGLPYAYLDKRCNEALPLTEEEFCILLSCDGTIDIEEDDTLLSLLKKEIIIPGAKELTNWQQYRNCNCRYIFELPISITGRCNCNCLHCFNAADNNASFDELTFSQLKNIIDECLECGIQNINLTGGEPTLHPNIRELIKYIYDKGLNLASICTNGLTLNRELLDLFKKYFPHMQFRISFDGLGFHDWMRNIPGCEEKALNAIRLVVEYDFHLMVNMNVNRKNKDSILPSIRLLDDLGVESTKIIVTTEAPRWRQNAEGMSLTLKEYDDFCIDFLKEWKETAKNMEVVFWQFGSFNPQLKIFHATPVKDTCANFKDSRPLCHGMRLRGYISPTGELYPCQPSSGYMIEQKMHLGNVLKEGLKKNLQEGDYVQFITQTIKGRLSNGKCGDCKYFKQCQGGCPILAMVFSDTHDPLNPDEFKCFYFENDYYDKTREALEGWKSLIPLE